MEIEKFEQQQEEQKKRRTIGKATEVKKIQKVNRIIRALFTAFYCLY